MVGSFPSSQSPHAARPAAGFKLAQRRGYGPSPFHLPPFPLSLSPHRYRAVMITLVQCLFSLVMSLACGTGGWRKRIGWEDTFFPLPMGLPPG